MGWLYSGGYCRRHGCNYDGDYCHMCREEGRHLIEDRGRIREMKRYMPRDACPVHGCYYDGECPYCEREKEVLRKALKKGLGS
jgi:predicted DCC family thiol-disulfide oxidoreductase YuxK